MELYNQLIYRKKKMCVIGLGYVGLPIAVSFARKLDVIGYDISFSKIETYKNGIDPTNEVERETLCNTSVEFTNNENMIDEASFYIVAIPTPVNDDHTPDLSPIIKATTTLGQHLSKGSVVVFESTVYPGVTEEICIPILENESGLICGVDFGVGYSPERINPGDKVHRFETIVKIVSGTDEKTLECIAKIYELVVEAGVYRATSIRIAEASKIVENCQRDINIAFMNELSIIFNMMGIDTKLVIEAASTKWNFMRFYPGLVGGHCIGVDPYYLTYKAEMLGYQSQIILAGRRINDYMGKYCAETCVKKLISAGKLLNESKVAILGFTFKENCPDTRNTKIIDIINELKEYGISPLVSDCRADPSETKHLYGINLVGIDKIRNMDAVIIAVSHDEYRSFTKDCVDLFFGKKTKVLLDLKGILDRNEYEIEGYDYWRM